MKTEKPLVDKEYVLERPEGKGAVTYVEIPEIPMAKAPFGMLKVRGRIDDYEFSDVHLMPLGNGNLVLAVKVEIKKKIKKEAPDTVHVTLYEDSTPLVIPEDLLLCMRDEDGLPEKFGHYSDGQKKAFTDWINSAKSDRARIDRIAKTITMVQNGEKFY